MLTKSLDDLIETGKKSLLDLFISSKEKEFQDFVDRNEHLTKIGHEFRRFKERLTDLESRHAILAEKLGFYKDANFAKSIFVWLEQNPDSAFRLMQISAELTPAVLLKENADEILKLSASAIQECGAAFDLFKKKHNAVLKELGLK